MILPSYSEMDKLIADARVAFSYAEEHFEELRSRAVSHVLYGPSAYGMGAAGPCSATKSKQRKLMKKTRRKVYASYELDNNYQILCQRDIRNDRIDCSVYYFELDGILYARPFAGDRNALYRRTVYCLKKDGDKPVFYAEAEPWEVTVQFYEYLSEEKVCVTSITYNPTSKITEFGVPMSWDAPYGAPNSPVQYSCFEDIRHDIDFSKWFA